MQKITRNPKMHVANRYKRRWLCQKQLLIRFFSKKLKFDPEAVVSDNDNMNFWNPRAFLHRKRPMRHTLPINRAGLKLPTFGTRLIGSFDIERSKKQDEWASASETRAPLLWLTAYMCDAILADLTLANRRQSWRKTIFGRTDVTLWHSPPSLELGSPLE